jgi:streptogrisin C
MRRLLAAGLAILGLLATAPAANAAPVPLEAGIQLTIGSSSRCVGGFNATSGGNYYLIIADVCGSPGAAARGGPGQVLIGTVSASGFPPSGYAVVRVTNLTNWQPAPLISRQSSGPALRILGSTEAPVGASVCMSSPVSGWSCGVVTAKNQTIQYPDGTVVTGVTRTTLCVHPGELGAPVVAGQQAQGHIIGGTASPSCTGYFKPINQVLPQLGLTLLT